MECKYECRRLFDVGKRKCVRSTNETRFTDLLMTKGLGKANDREVFVIYESMNV